MLELIEHIEEVIKNCEKTMRLKSFKANDVYKMICTKSKKDSYKSVLNFIKILNDDDTLTFNTQLNITMKHIEKLTYKAFDNYNELDSIYEKTYNLEYIKNLKYLHYYMYETLHEEIFSC